MNGPVPVEINRRGLQKSEQGFEHIPHRDPLLRKQVVSHLNKMQPVPVFTTNQVTPSAASPIHDSSEFRAVGAVRTDAEPDNGEFTPKNVVRLVTEELQGNTGQDYRVITGPGKQGARMYLKRLRQMLRKAV